MSEFPLQAEATAVQRYEPTRPLYWSIRRELWENRSLYVAPAIVAAIFLFGFAISTITLPRRMRAGQATVEMPYDMVAAFIIATIFVVGVFYCLDALHGERRDRSILFWKSLPISDTTAVLAKAAIPLAVLPIYAFVVIVITQMAMFFLNNLALAADPHSLGLLWTQLKFVQMTIGLLYVLIVIALWHAPLYGWLLLVSVWARRATLVWAALPIITAYFFETIAFHTQYVAKFAMNRFYGFFLRAFVQGAEHGSHLDPLAALTPGRFLATPSLWIGLMFAAAFLAATVRLRRYRSPL